MQKEKEQTDRQTFPEAPHTPPQKLFVEGTFLMSWIFKQSCVSGAKSIVGVVVLKQLERRRAAAAYLKR